jgi:hypothetical protein
MNNGLVMAAKEARALIATAEKPREHLKLAAYFNQQADGYDAQARDHEEMI